MTTSRLWIIVGSAAAAIAVLVLILVVVGPSSTPPTGPTPTATSTSTPTPTPTSTATPTPTPSTTTAPGPTTATCENTSTEEFQAMMAQNGWISWNLLDGEIGARPFEVFPGGEPIGQIVCRWGADPDLPTDNTVDLAWAPIDPYEAVSAMQQLEASGATRTDATDGSGNVQFTGDTVVGGAYLFTPYDVRWAATVSELAYIKAPDDPR